MLFGQEINNLTLILLSQSCEIKYKSRIGSGFERVLNMKPNLNLINFSTQKQVNLLVVFMVFVALS